MLQHLAKYFERRARIISYFRKAQQGATAVEFALIAPAFLATLIAVFEVAGYLFAQQVLQTAAVDAARYYLTGQGQSSNMNQTTLVGNVCPIIKALMNCNNLIVDMQVYSTYGGANLTSPTLTYNAQGQVTNTWQFNAGIPGQLMVIRLIYQWPIVSAPLGFMLTNNGNGTTTIMGVSAFRVEPYS
jgi:Flp pilus assembly protein TadG